MPTPMPETITIRIVTAPPHLIDGVYLDSPYVDQFWCPVIGPSAVMMLKAFDRIGHGQAGCRTEVIKIQDLAREIGVGAKGGNDSAVWRTIHRLARFNLIGLEAGYSVVSVRDRLPRLSNARQWPEHVAVAHRSLVG